MGRQISYLSTNDRGDHIPHRLSLPASDTNAPSHLRIYSYMAETGQGKAEGTLTAKWMDIWAHLGD